MAAKKCPFCAEEIQAEAIKCRFCGANIDNLKNHKYMNWNIEQKTCLWIAIGIIDMVGALFLYHRIIRESINGNTYYKCESSDFLIFAFLIIITAAALIFSLQDRPVQTPWHKYLFGKDHFKIS